MEEAEAIELKNVKKQELAQLAQVVCILHALHEKNVCVPCEAKEEEGSKEGREEETQLKLGAVPSLPSADPTEVLNPPVHHLPISPSSRCSSGELMDGAELGKICAIRDAVHSASSIANPTEKANSLALRILQVDSVAGLLVKENLASDLLGVLVLRSVLKALGEKTCLEALTSNSANKIVSL